MLISANYLPCHHKDPADRFIIATALKEKAAVVTADERFKKYKVKVII
ncbi:MAG: PIN domain-containing protein [bacterium]